MANRAVVWIELAGPGQKKAVALVPENPEPRPQNVNDFDSWMTAKWRVHSAGGVTASEFGRAVIGTATTFVAALNLEHD